MILQCISSSTISLLLNGSPTKCFSPSRGLRQGDPISPYLFILCMEGFSRIISNAVSENLIIPVKPAVHAPRIYHLFFADDCILFTRATCPSITDLLHVINQFCAASGQLINFHKSSMHFSSRLSPAARQDICSMLNMSPMPFHEKYLGISLFISKNKTKFFDGTVSKMKSRLLTWQGKLINQAGRTTQIQSVLNIMGLPNVLSPFTRLYFETNEFCPETILVEQEASKRDILEVLVIC